MARRRARPTLRCLREDLVNGLEDARLRRTLKRGALPHPSICLDTLPHPLVQTIAERFLSAPPEPRDRIESVRDNVWYRDRHGDWRGVIWFAQDNQPWICFAGHRQQGSPDDVYAEFERACQHGGRVDSSPFLPGQDDYARLDLETAVRAHAAQERQLKRTVVETIVRAAGAQGKAQTADLLEGAALLHVEIRAGDPGEIYLSIEVVNYAAMGQDVTDLVLGAVPGIGLYEWDNAPPRGEHATPLWYALLSLEWLQRFVAAADDQGIDDFCTSPPDLSDDSGGYAHIVRGTPFVDAIVAGTPVRSLCGRRFLPSKLPDSYPMCPQCAVLWEAIEMHRQTTSE